jgi:ribonuclease P protein component
MLYGTIPGRESPGGACVISKKVAGTAIVRNKVKRQVRSGLLPFLGEIRAPLVVILTAKKGAEGASAADLRAEIKALTSKIH